MRNLRLAFRTLRSTPFITAVAVLSLALGIGANAAIFSLFDQMLLRALPVQQPERLVNLASPGPKPGSQSCGQAGDCDTVFSYPMFKDLSGAESGFSGIAAHLLFDANLAVSGHTMKGQGLLISGSYFGVLGVRPALGRLIGPADDKDIGAHFVAVLSYDYWENRLGSDPNVLNKAIIVNGHSMTIVGVAQRGFRGTTLGGSPDVFVPVTMRGQMTPGFRGFQNRRQYWAYLFGRLKPGVNLDQARSRINTLYSGIINEVEAPLQKGMSERTLKRFRSKQITLEDGLRGQSTLHGEVRTPMILLFAITGVVLLIACVNIANLLLARGAKRRQELATRASLGATRYQLLVQLLAESCLLAILGGVAGLIVARLTLTFIASILPSQDAAPLSFGLSPSVIAFTGILSIGTSLVFGLYPALHNTRSDLVTLLKESAGQPSGARAAARFRAALVTVQISLSMALLVVAGLFVKSLLNVGRIDLGLRSDKVITFGISPELNGYTPEQSLALFGRVEEELAAIPGVISVSAARVPLLAGNSWGTDVSVEGFESGPDIDSNSRYNQVGAGFLATLGMPLLVGREFAPSDSADAPKVAMVNQAFARKFGLDGPAALGKWMSTRGGGGTNLDIQIVGVVRDAKYNDVKRAVPPVFFTPYRQDGRLGSINFYLRTSLDPSLALRAIPDVIRRVDPNLPIEELKTLKQQVNENTVLDRMISTLLTAFAVLATLLTAVGLYGVLAYSVAQRTREIGLRMALGADGRRVRLMVLRQVGRLVLVGGIVGIVAALMLGRAASSLLFGLEGHDPFVLTVVTLLLGGVALGAGYIPALRASKVDPMEALRYE